MDETPTTTAPNQAQGVDFLQVARPRDWMLPDEVVLPNGCRVGGARARVYALLEATRDRRLSWKIGRHTGPPGAVPTHIVRELWSGSQEGTKRLRELRDHFGCKITREPWVSPEGRVTSTWLYRLVDVGPARAAGTPAAGRPRANQPAHPSTPPDEETEGGAAHHSPPTAPPSAHPPPFQALTAWLVRGTPEGLVGRAQATATYDVTPGGPGWLAPSESLTRRAAAGHLDQDAARAAYREELLALYHSGRLTRSLTAHRRVVLWTGPGVFDPLPMLAHALHALGARILWEDASA